MRQVEPAAGLLQPNSAGPRQIGVEPQAAVSAYRVHLALIVLAGNRTRYEIVRPLVDADPRVSADWSPIRTWVEGDWLSLLPGMTRVRLRNVLDARRALAAAPDAMIIHAFETYFMYALLRGLRRLRTAVVWNSDGPPPPAGEGLAAMLKRRAIIDTDLFVPFSQWAADGLLERYPELDPRRVRVLHPGLPLEKWPRRPERHPGTRFKLLFVGGEPARKGLDTLVDAFDGALQDDCRLHVMTQAAFLPSTLRSRLERRPHVVLELDRRATPATYAAADAFVLPTRSDCSSWVALEAMASGLPVITTAVDGLSDIVIPGATGLVVPPDDPAALVAAVRALMVSANLRYRLADSARQHVEQNFDARSNTEHLLDLVISAIDDRRRP